MKSFLNAAFAAEQSIYNSVCRGSFIEPRFCAILRIEKMERVTETGHFLGSFRKKNIPVCVIGTSGSSWRAGRYE